MANIQAQYRPTTDLIGDEAEVRVKSLKDGTLSVADFIAIMSLEGRVFSAQGGSVTTPVTFGAGSIDSTEPDLKVLVPTNTSIIPIEISIVMETYGTTALFEYMASIGQGSTVAMGTDTDLTIYNVNLGHANGSNCTAGAASNNDAVYPTSNIIELIRGTEAVAVTLTTADDDSTWQPTNFIWRLKDSGYLPILNGKGSLDVFAAAQAGTGFVSAKWIELPTAWLS